MRTSRHVRPLFAVASLFLLSCSSDATGPQAVATITVTPPAAVLASGGTVTLSATTLDGSGAVLTGRTITWRTSDAAVATVSSSGVVTAGEVAGGSNALSTITASSEGVNGTAALSVTPAAVASVTLTAASATLASGGTLPVTLTVRAASGTILTGRPITWSSSDPARAAVSGTGVVTASELTLATAVPVTIQATAEGVNGTLALSVTPAPAAVVIVTPSTLTLNSDGTTTLVAVVRSASGAALAGRVITWTSSASAVATVATTGLVTAGRVLGGVVAPVTITATSEGIAGTAALSVNPVPVASVSVAAPAGYDGLLDFGETLALSATMRDDAGSVLAGRAVAWSVQGGPATVSAVGSVLAGEVPGGANTFAIILATSEGVESFIVLSVAPVPTATVTVTPGTTTYFVQAEQLLTATPRSASGTTLSGRTVVWSSSDETRAFFPSAGLMRAVGSGAVSLTATVEGQVGSVSVSVTGWERIATGDGHTCAVASSGATYCWGQNLAGELGNGTTTPASRPSPVDGASSFSQLAAGASVTCGIRSFAVYCWGRNSSGELGDSTVTNRLVPRLQRSTAYASELPVQVDDGNGHGCLVTDVGAIYCWGANQVGQLGNNTTTTRLAPTPVLAGTVVYSQVSAGFYHSCAVSTSSRVYCWGDNTLGQLGDGTYTNRWVPVAVSSGTFTQVSAGSAFSCAIALGNTAACWGRNTSGALGDGGTTSRSTPSAVSGGRSFTRVATGDNHACALTAAGDMYCWGANASGQLGDGTFATRLVPTLVSDGTGSRLPFVTLDVGANHTCGLTTGGVMYCWGANTYGQLGNGPWGAAAVPVPVLPPL